MLQLHSVLKSTTCWWLHMTLLLARTFDSFSRLANSFAVFLSVDYMKFMWILRRKILDRLCCSYGCYLLLEISARLLLLLTLVCSVCIMYFELTLQAYSISCSHIYLKFMLILQCIVSGTIALVTIPALYSKNQEQVDRYAGMVHRNISRHYKIVDENVMSRLPRSFIRDKEDWFV